MTFAGLFAKHCFVKAVGWFVKLLVSCAKILFRYIRYSNAIILAFYSIGLFAGPPQSEPLFQSCSILKVRFGIFTGDGDTFHHLDDHEGCSTRALGFPVFCRSLGGLSNADGLHTFWEQVPELFTKNI